MDKHYTAFRGHRLLAHGSLDEVSQAAAAHAAKGPTVLVFEDGSGQQVDLDPRGLKAAAAAAAQASPPAARSPGRPKLGVVAREVTLLPRHWEWLSMQPGGASVALRKLVEEARRAKPQDRVRAAQERCYRFLQAIAGDLPGYEEALRALFSQRAAAFDDITAGWPEGIRRYAHQLAGPALAASEKDPSS